MHATNARGEIHLLDRNTGELLWRSDPKLRFWDRSPIVHQIKLIADRRTRQILGIEAVLHRDVRQFVGRLSVHWPPGASALSILKL